MVPFTSPALWDWRSKGTGGTQRVPAMQWRGQVPSLLIIAIPLPPCTKHLPPPCTKHQVLRALCHGLPRKTPKEKARRTTARFLSFPPRAILENLENVTTTAPASDHAHTAPNAITPYHHVIPPCPAHRGGWVGGAPGMAPLTARYTIQGALRFSKNAAMPARASSPSQVSTNRLIVSSTISSVICGPRSRASFLLAATASGAAAR